MKRILLTAAYFFVCMLSIQAQTLYGVTPSGGNDRGGTINRFIATTNELTVLKSFESPPANPYYTNLVQANDGKLYGTTRNGGIYGYGTIYSYDTTSGVYTKVKDFDLTTVSGAADGAAPYGSLIKANNGKLYGMASEGGSGHKGVIFSYDPSNSAYTKLYDFDTEGSSPHGNLLQASDGLFYGMTLQGGNNNVGVIFSFDPSLLIYTKLKDFDVATGTDPYGSLIQASDGKLYGMALDGGASNAGTIFSFVPASSTFAILKNFDVTEGANPYGTLMQASDGKLYGMTARGGKSDKGVIFSLDALAGTYTDMEDFDSTNGATPYGSLVQANNGKLYAMTSGGGSNNQGVIFSLDPSTATYARLRDFDSNGGHPFGGFTQPGNGKFYAVTSAGGGGNAGIIFSFDPSSTNYAKLINFDNAEGRNPSGSLVQASGEKLYGMTTNGGSNGLGVIYSFDPSSSTYTKLKDFDNTSGAGPSGSLVRAADGKLYGMTTYGGSSNAGVIFSYDPSSATYTKLVDFNIANGSTPTGSLIQASNGKLYGMTPGGPPGYGNIFSYDPSTSAFINELDFQTSTSGAGPMGNLIQASDGKLYGMTEVGGIYFDRNGMEYGNGDIFSYDPSTSTYALLYNFDLNGDNGVFPYGSLIQANDGKLYGMASAGGSNDHGVIFSYDPSSSTVTNLKDFDNTNGASPRGKLLQASDGKLYGMTYLGGSGNVGVIFSFDPVSSDYVKLQDFDTTNGAYPYYDAAFIELAESGPLPVTLLNFTGKNNGTINNLSWKVVNEQNLNFYELQRSVDGQNFKMITQIKATGHNSYSYSDPVAATASLYYYRLRSVDKDGHFKYSVVIKIQTNRKGVAIVNPNPFRDKLIVSIESLLPQKAVFILNDLNGRQLYKDNRMLSPGTNTVEITETSRFSKGTYLLTIIQSQQTQTIKVIKGD